ncbi:elongation of very long chain fatty acids protein 1-like [Colletes gigas]|uniref:elongation of very long chain fatty acids protein 1-like n=1 Tax=Colletes gigas TaxID=935657 RepID=UPI001C9BB81C|nr:elongation of very long chain fatty acids protein 1-like [Colletes gigas]
MDYMEIYDYYWNQNADPRTNVLPFVGSPILIPVILFSYLYFVLKCGPEYMKNKKPYELKTYVKFYNIFQIFTNAYIIQQFIEAGWFSEITMFCEMPDYSYDPGPLKLSFTMWIAMMLKMIDLTETVVFVLRKKQNQITVLHVYHHVSTLLLIWLSTKYIAVAMASFMVLVNCFIHVIMYTYYYLSTFGEKTRRVINPFKPWLTIMQMAQFIVLMVQNTISLLPYCEVTKVPATVSIVNLSINFMLFYNFYQKSYKSKQKKS